MFKSFGVLKYSIKDDYYRLIVEVDPELHRYFRSLIPKYFKCNPQRYPPHITVVRGEIVKSDKWLKYEDKIISFEYEFYLHYFNNYWWFNCFSQELIDIRLELGLPSSYYLTRPPDSTECFHSTVGNSK